ncbi:MAG: DUF411 domain-containing protein [Gemmatimonadaceae bacterium]
MTPSDTIESVSDQSRRRFLSTIGRGAVALVSASLAAPLFRQSLNAESVSAPAPLMMAPPTPMVVYKDPGCGCCKEWVKIMQKAGFAITTHDTADMNAVKTTMGVPGNLQSCHTAIVGTYVFEGHVPADVVQKFLTEKPVARGLSVPGMPNGSPGMEGPTKDKYDVVLFERSGKTRVYASR